MTTRYSFGIYEKALPQFLTWKERFTDIRNTGFDFMEMSIDESEERLKRLDWTDEDIQKVTSASLSCNLPIQSICLSAHRRYPMGSNDENIHKKSMEIMEKAIVLAYRMGVRIIQLAGYDVYYEPADDNTHKRFVESLERSVRLAASYGVVLALETMENEYMNTIQKALWFVERINSPYLQIYPDIGNVTNGAVSVDTDILAGNGHIAAAHLKETAPGIYRDLMFGEGAVKFDKAIALLKKQGVSIYTAEFWYHDGEDHIKNIEYAYRYLKRFIDEKEI